MCVTSLSSKPYFVHFGNTNKFKTLSLTHIHTHTPLLPNYLSIDESSEHNMNFCSACSIPFPSGNSL